MATSSVTSIIVVDASVAVWALLPSMAPVDIIGQLINWRQVGVEFYAPSLWLAECTSAIRRYVHTGLITPAEGLTAVDDLLALDVNIAPTTHAQCRAAFTWAERLGQSRAYDGFYLALADELGATLWTADRRLASAAHQLGLAWVRRFEE